MEGPIHMQRELEEDVSSPLHGPAVNPVEKGSRPQMKHIGEIRFCHHFWMPVEGACILAEPVAFPAPRQAVLATAEVEEDQGEIKETQILKEKFPRATAIKVTDISGDCRTMYEIQVKSEEFKKRTVQQHQMVNQTLKEKIKCMHGLWIFTSVPRH
ncbi:hypothetical protein DBR06_SOUSAS1610127 [Sousa chinensis]|uniref:BolA-like protein 3 n=1 Tax=Sousa chinensis TaxID=103600 RepID=A0A484H457_SOUCH|nr:hypothetical protein DBR06_SOUSAS1610127 [Sousa chinensis]